MDGPGHFRAAEKAFAKAQRAAKEVDGASVVVYLQTAQYHAAMAQVCATLEPRMSRAWAYALTDSYEEEDG